MAYDKTKGLVAVYNQQTSTYVPLPLDSIGYENYTAAPDQVLDLDSYVSETGVLIRTVLDHTRTKVEFSTPYTDSTKWQPVLAIIKAGYVDNGRRLKLRYYDDDTDGYKTGWFYVPDIEYSYRHVDNDNEIIHYGPIRVAFIEY